MLFCLLLVLSQDALDLFLTHLVSVEILIGCLAGNVSFLEKPNVLLLGGLRLFRAGVYLLEVSIVGTSQVMKISTGVSEHLRCTFSLALERYRIVRVPKNDSRRQAVVFVGMMFYCYSHSKI